LALNPCDFLKMFDDIRDRLHPSAEVEIYALTQMPKMGKWNAGNVHMYIVPNHESVDSDRLDRFWLNAKSLVRTSLTHLEINLSIDNDSDRMRQNNLSVCELIQLFATSSIKLVNIYGCLASCDIGEDANLLNIWINKLIMRQKKYIDIKRLCPSDMDMDIEEGPYYKNGTFRNPYSKLNVHLEHSQNDMVEYPNMEWE
jgi:hypothetical protein